MKRWLTSVGAVLFAFVCAWLVPGVSFAAEAPTESGVETKASQVIKQGAAEFSTYVKSSKFKAPSGNLKLWAETTKGTNWYVKLCRPNGDCSVTNAIGPYKKGRYEGTFKNVPGGTYYLHFYKEKPGKTVKMSYILHK